MTSRAQLLLSTVLVLLQGTLAFVPLAPRGQQSTRLFAEDVEKAAPLVSGEELELILTELEQPLVIDAYATWCGPCLIQAYKGLTS